MMTTIAHRELRNNSSDILRRVTSGESFEITNNGEVVAELHPPTTDRLAGIAHRPARVRGGFEQIQTVKSGQTTQELLDFLRADR